MDVCMIPARSGSVRLAKKNYLEIGSSTVLEITIAKAVQSGVFDRVVVNSDDPKLRKVAKKLGADFYLRDESLATSSATSDQVVFDFIGQNEGQRLFWVNTASPLQTIGDIQNFVYQAKDPVWASSVSINSSQVHLMYQGTPLNFEWNSGFARTQDLAPVMRFNYAMMGWHYNCADMLGKGQLFNKHTSFVESSVWSGFLLKTEADLDLIRQLAEVAPDQGRPLGG